MSLSEIDKREVCPLHGWVGRRLFQQDRHDLCEAPEGTVFDEYADGNENADADDEAEAEVEAEEAEAEEAEDGEFTSNAGGASDRTSARRRGIPPKKTLAVRKITRLELAAGQAELRALGADVPYERPRTRGDCERVPRPCPYVGCKYSLYLDVSKTGSIILNFPHLEPGQMPAEQSCALDLADRAAVAGPMTLENIAVVTNLTRERIRQVELRALSRRARPAAIAMGLGSENVRVGVRPRLQVNVVDSGGPTAARVVSSDGSSSGGEDLDE